MSRAFIGGCGEQLPYARITVDEVHVAWRASTAVDKMRRSERRSNRSLKGMRLALFKDRSLLSAKAAVEALIARVSMARTARAQLY